MTFKRFALWSDSSGAIVGLLNCCLFAPLKGGALITHRFDLPSGCFSCD